MDKTTDLSCKDSIAHHGVDGEEPTHNRQVSAGLGFGRCQQSVSTPAYARPRAASCGLDRSGR
jgi:hypothetical protein